MESAYAKGFGTTFGILAAAGLYVSCVYFAGVGIDLISDYFYGPSDIDRRKEEAINGRFTKKNSKMPVETENSD